MNYQQMSRPFHLQRSTWDEFDQTISLWTEQHHQAFMAVQLILSCVVIREATGPPRSTIFSSTCLALVTTYDSECHGVFQLPTRISFQTYLVHVGTWGRVPRIPVLPSLIRSPICLLRGTTWGWWNHMSVHLVWWILDVTAYMEMISVRWAKYWRSEFMDPSGREIIGSRIMGVRSWWYWYILGSYSPTPGSALEVE